MSSARRIAFALLLCAGCTQPDRQQNPPGDTLASTAKDTVRVRVPNEKPDSIQIEGSWQPLHLQLFHPQSSIPFLTYVPSDMIAETRQENGGEAHYFIANFAGKRNDDAYLLIFFLPAGTSEQDAVRTAREFRDSRTRSGYVADAELRRHGDRFYFIARHYPAEYGDGFGPRSQKIQDEWQWLD